MVRFWGQGCGRFPAPPKQQPTYHQVDIHSAKVKTSILKHWSMIVLVLLIFCWTVPMDISCKNTTSVSHTPCSVTPAPRFLDLSYHMLVNIPSALRLIVSWIVRKFSTLQQITVKQNKHCHDNLGKEKITGRQPFCVTKTFLGINSIRHDSLGQGFARLSSTYSIFSYRYLCCCRIIYYWYCGWLKASINQKKIFRQESSKTAESFLCRAVRLS